MSEEFKNIIETSILCEKEIWKLPNEIFLTNKYKESREWIQLEYFAKQMAEAGVAFLKYGKKLNPPLPDFLLKSCDGKTTQMVEIVEVQRPGRKRHDEYRERKENGQTCWFLPAPHPTPYLSLKEALLKKANRPYASEAWLFVYFNMTAFDFADHLEWHERMMDFPAIWVRDDPIHGHFGKLPFPRIYAVGPSGRGLVEFKPNIRLLLPEKIGPS